MSDKDQITALRTALRPFVDGASAVRQSLVSRLKMHPVALRLWDEQVKQAREVLERTGSTS